MGDKTAILSIFGSDLHSKVKDLINSARKRAAVALNSETVMLYWRIGLCIKEEILKNRRADYGKKVVKNLAEALTQEFGQGWSLRTLQYCLSAADFFSEEQIVHAVRAQLGWTHLKMIMAQPSEVQRMFYMQMAAIGHWSTRELQARIQSATYERSALSRKPEEVIKAELEQVGNSGELTPDLVFKSSYILDFLGLKDKYSEFDLEEAILNEIQSFIKELGTDFAFLERQKRFTLDGIDYKIDLLFYHRSLRRLIAIDLKLGKFLPDYEGQMRMYLRWLDRNERKEYELSPIGLILCSEGNTEHVEYLMLEDSTIRIAQYYTVLPDEEILKMKLQRALTVAQEHLLEQEQFPDSGRAKNETEGD